MKCWNAEVLKFWYAGMDENGWKLWNEKKYEMLKCWIPDMLINWNSEVLKCWNVEMLKCWNAEMLKCWNYEIMNWLKMAWNGWNWPGFVMFRPLVLSMNRFNNDDEQNVMAFITVLTVSRYKKKNATNEFGTDCFALFV